MDLDEGNPSSHGSRPRKEKDEKGLGRETRYISVPHILKEVGKARGEKYSISISQDWGVILWIENARGHLL